MIGSGEQLDAEKLLSRYSDVVLTDGESFHACARYDAFASICHCPDEYVKFPK